MQNRKSEKIKKMELDMNDKIKMVMEEILGDIRQVETEWENLTKRYTKAGAVRLRKALDSIAKKKVELRKEMLEQERK